MKNKLKKYLFFVLLFFLGYLIFSGIRIYNYSSTYSEDACDVGIVLGAGTKNGVVSPIFRERLNHSIYLYNKEKIGKIILTGGYGKNQDRTDSEIAK
jgi:vancomycin permeability regulator SanA